VRGLDPRIQSAPRDCSDRRGEPGDESFEKARLLTQSSTSRANAYSLCSLAGGLSASRQSAFAALVINEDSAFTSIS
jgi:hypothetical protein